jgi:hypothetical protein
MNLAGVVLVCRLPKQYKEYVKNTLLQTIPHFPVGTMYFNSGAGIYLICEMRTRIQELKLNFTFEEKLVKF